MVEGWDVGGAEALQTWVPTAGAAIGGLVAAWPRGLAAEHLRSIRTVTAEALGLSPLRRPPLGPGPRAAVTSLTVMTFAEQLAVDVTEIRPEQRQAWTAATAPFTHDATVAAYVADSVPRARAALDALFGLDAWYDTDPVPTPHVSLLVDELSREVVLTDVLDPVTTELVRLRVARHLGSQVGMGRRNLDAVRAGADAATFAAVDHYRGSLLSATQQAALGLVDAMIWTPAHPRAHDLDAVRRHLGPAEAVAVVLAVLRGCADKVAIALGADEAGADGIQLFVHDESGDVCFP